MITLENSPFLLTKNVKAAIKSPRKIDVNLVDSQQARRILDRIVGYKLSPYLWKTVKSGLSAGRVQSVATKIIVERENEIKSFIPKEYWLLDATFKNNAVNRAKMGKRPDGICPFRVLVLFSLR